MIKTLSMQVVDSLPAWSNGVTARVLEDGERETCLLTLDPGGVLGGESHERDEVIVVLRGSVTVQEVDGFEQVYAEAQSTLIRGGTWHRLMAGSRGALVAAWWGSGETSR